MDTKDQLKVNGVQYRRRLNKCSKPGCKCNNPGQGHGPYWYASSDAHALKYVGVNLPGHLIKHIELLKASGPKLKALKAKIIKRRDDAQEALRKAERELLTVQNLEAGEYTASEVLKSLGLEQFNGQGKE
jgi:hypothetical protein